MRRLQTVPLALAALLAAAGACAQTWQELPPQQRAALAPLERDWASLDAERRQKWVEIAERMPRMSADERQRIQGRMAEWSRMSPDERGRARQRYQESRGVDAQERQQRWEAYQALPPERRRELAQGARPLPRAGSARGTDDGPPQGKSNIVPSPSSLPPPKQVAPNVLQARPGATTTPLTRLPAPPAHQQTGLPKIAAQPGFVDRSTLLPQRGPQAAATQPAPKAPAERDDKKR